MKLCELKHWFVFENIFRTIQEKKKKTVGNRTFYLILCKTKYYGIRVFNFSVPSSFMFLFVHVFVFASQV